jgi:hypothetical protein
VKVKFIYLLIGILLIFGVILTGVTTIDNETMKLIEKSLEINTEEIWPGFKLSDYPIDINYKKVEFRYEDGEILEQKPTLEVLALSAIMEDGQGILKVLPFGMVRNISDLGGMDIITQENMYISILVHEGFHCFQFENGLSYLDLKNMDQVNLESMKKQDFDNLDYMLDEDKNYQRLWVDEINSLLSYFNTGSLDEFYKSKSEKENYEKIVLGDKFEEFSQYRNEFELQEGTARYVEERVLEILGESNHTLEFDGGYRKGVEKYYFSGAIKSYILKDKGKLFDEVKFDSKEIII